jgi:predicted HTH domain antitoxin
MKSLKKVEKDLEELLNHDLISKASYDENDSKKEGDGDEIKLRLEDLKYSLTYVNEEIQYLRNYISELREDLHKHLYEGHFPKIDSASQLSKVLEILELDKDYEVKKKQIYTQSSSAGADCLIF